MDIYDVLVERELAPNHELNDVLVRVCGVDKASVLRNAKIAEKRANKSKR